MRSSGAAGCPLALPERPLVRTYRRVREPLAFGHPVRPAEMSLRGKPHSAARGSGRCAARTEVRLVAAPIRSARRSTAKPLAPRDAGRGELLEEAHGRALHRLHHPRRVYHRARLSGCQIFTCTAQFVRIDPGFQVQRPAAIRGVTSLRSPHFAGFRQNSVHTPTTGDRFPVGESGLGRNRALRGSLTDTGYCPGNGRRPTRLRPWCGRWVATRWQGGLPSETRTLAIRLYTGCGRSRHRA